jgi:polyisoprenoid-binding protein YceI
MTRLARALAGLLAVAAAPVAGAETLEASAESGRIVVHVWRRGLFSAFAHDHHLEVTRWAARVELPDGDPGAARVEVTLAADSLRDRQTSLSDADRRKVDAQAAGPEVLDAARHPEIVFRAERVALDPAGGGPAGSLGGTLHGTLALRGRERPLAVSFEARREGGGWRLRGKALVKQSDFGIEPFRAYGGAVGVKNGLDVELDLALRGSGPRSP